MLCRTENIIKCKREATLLFLPATDIRNNVYISREQKVAGQRIWPRDLRRWRRRQIKIIYAAARGKVPLNRNTVEDTSAQEVGKLRLQRGNVGEVNIPLNMKSWRKKKVIVVLYQIQRRVSVCPFNIFNRYRRRRRTANWLTKLEGGSLMIVL